MKKEYVHVPVLLNEVVEALNLPENAIFVDATVGGAGHSYEIMSKTKNAKLFAFDRDQEALRVSKKRLEKYDVTFFHNNFKEMPKLLEKFSGQIDGILVDLGVSSYQIDENSRGFSFKTESRLDMRMNQEDDLSAYEVINTYSEKELADVIYQFGEEKFSRRIARNIVEYRKTKNIEKTSELVTIIRKSVFGDAQKSIQRTFQAIRIEVNHELDGLEQFVRNSIQLLKKGGRIAVISFHSLEDRIIKNVFKECATDCICPPKTPICICGHKASIKIINKHPIEAKEAEMIDNTRSTCAKLRIAEKI